MTKFNAVSLFKCIVRKGSDNQTMIIASVSRYKRFCRRLYFTDSVCVIIIFTLFLETMMMLDYCIVFAEVSGATNLKVQFY